MKKVVKLSLWALTLVVLSSGALAVSSLPPSKTASSHQIMMAKASWYGPGFHGRKTANGETYNMYGISVAHKSLPFGTWLRVTNVKNNQRLFVRVNDRGPYIHGREIDLSLGAAKALDITHQGVAQVKIEVFRPDTTVAQSLNEIYNVPVKAKRKKVAQR